MANQKQLAVLMRGVSTWNKWRSTRQSAKINLSLTNLQGIDLHGVNLYKANLRGANLNGTKSRNADLGGANLRGADVSVFFASENEPTLITKTDPPGQ